MTLSQQQLRDLKLIQNCPASLRKHLLKKLPLRSVKGICECSLNVLNGNLPISSQQKKKLRKYKVTLRKIANRKESLPKKKKIIIQEGGFLNILIPAAISAISTLIHGVQ